MNSAGLRLRWSWRDLRQRWVQVVVIALIIALGTGIFAALGSTATWRRASNDASFATASYHDVRLRLSDGTAAEAGRLLALVDALPSASSVTAAEERLVWPTQVQADTPDGELLVTGELVGQDPGASVDRVLTREGAAPPAGELAGQLEFDFARFRDLPTSGSLRLSGGATLPYTGLAQGPEYFIVMPEGGQWQVGGHAVLFVPLAAAQELAGRDGQVNDVVLTLAEGTDPSKIEAELTDALAGAGVSGQVTVGTEEPTYTLLYEDIENDQQIWNLVSVLILGGASVAAFNLISRIVEAQRREIGIGMALGVPPRELAVRPILVGLQIALLGVVFGLGVGYLMARLMEGFMDQALPLPIWVTDFQADKFLQALLIGLALPLIATVIPVLRAVRMAPVEAIRTGHFATASSGWARAASHLPWPRRALQLFPVRNLLRTPRRTLLTALAIGAVITLLVFIFGMLDSFVRTIDRSDAALTGDSPERLTVQLSTFGLVDDPTVTAVEQNPAVGEAATALVLPAELSDGTDEPIDVHLEVLDFDAAPWAPNVLQGEPPSAGGILLSTKAARDLGLDVGDTVVLTHPERVGLGYRMVESRLAVSGLHDVPLRGFAYVDTSQAGLFGLEGITNRLQVVPAPGVSTLEAQKALFSQPGVASAVPVGEASESFEDALTQFTGILRVLQGAVLLLALLIAFNASSIGVDERARENATMFAFGVPRRSVLGMTVAESAVLGVLGTVIGAGLGYLVMQYTFRRMLPEVLPEIDIQTYLTPGTMVTIAVLGILAVAVAPLFTYRRLRRMDIPSTLRVVE